MVSLNDITARSRKEASLEVIRDPQEHRGPVLEV